MSRLSPGRWVIGVSGGADSVALLRLLEGRRPDVSLTVAHLNHQARGDASDADAAFVKHLADSLNIECVGANLSDFASTPVRDIEAAYRAARHALFRRVAIKHQAVGVLTAHHADDRAETVLLRLLRGGEPAALGGLRFDAMIDGLHFHRPLLAVRRASLERYLQSIGQPWRVDASNALPAFARNRVRAFLATRPDLVEPLLEVANAADALRNWLQTTAPHLSDVLDADALADLPDPLARTAARRWLSAHGVPRPDADAAERLVSMATDRTSAARADFPGEVRVIRRKNRLLLDS